MNEGWLFLILHFLYISYALVNAFAYTLVMY